MNFKDFKETDCKLIDTFIQSNNIEEIEENIKIIKLFNLFLTSNPNYLYNKTYILDLLEKFINNIKIMKGRYKISIELDKLFKSSEYIKCNNGYCFAVIDDYFIITSLTKIGGDIYTYSQLTNYLRELAKTNKDLKNNLEVIKNKVSKYISCNNLYNLSKKITVRVFYNEFDRLFYYKNEKYDDFIKKIQLFITECDKIIESRKNNEKK